MEVSLTEKIKFYESIFGRGLLSRDEKNFSIRCPICDPRDPHKKKLVIRTADDVTHCWVCGFSSRSLAPLLRKYASQSALASYIERFAKAEKLLQPDEEAKKSVEAPPDARILTVAADSDPDALAVYRYVVSRGVTERDIWFRKICYTSAQPWSRRVTFLSHSENGDLNYITARAIDKKQFPRYVNCDADRNSIVFQEVNIDWSSPIVLCEGPFDLLKCGDNATCLLGSEISESSLLFDRIVTHGTPVILALDSDTHTKKRPRIIKKLQEYDISVSIVELGSYHDPGSAPRDFMLECISKARPVDWYGMFASRLEALTGSL